MNRIPLELRLSRIREGKLSDPTVYKGLPESIGELTLRSYLEPKLLKDFATYLGMEDDLQKLGAMRYGEAAALIRKLAAIPEQREGALDAMYQLLKPYLLEFKRRSRNEKNKS